MRKSGKPLKLIISCFNSCNLQVDKFNFVHEQMIKLVIILFQHILIKN